MIYCSSEIHFCFSLSSYRATVRLFIPVERSPFFMNWLRRVMMGRYGVDQLTIVVLVLSFTLTLVAQIIRSPVLTIFSFLLLAYCYFRIFSKNLQKRYQENQRFLSLWSPIGSWFKLQRRKFKDRKTHCYFRCPRCSNHLRVPKGKGKIEITCPVCKNQFVKKT